MQALLEKNTAGGAEASSVCYLVGWTCLRSIVHKAALPFSLRCSEPFVRWADDGHTSPFSFARSRSFPLVYSPLRGPLRSSQSLACRSGSPFLSLLGLARRCSRVDRDSMYPEKVSLAACFGKNKVAYLPQASSTVFLQLATFLDLFGTSFFKIFFLAALRFFY